MASLDTLDRELEQRLSSRLMDVLIRAGLVLAVVLLCYRVFAPFLTLTAWALILAVTLYPLHRAVAGKLKGRQGVSATLLALLGIVVFVAPTAVLMSSLGDWNRGGVVRVHNTASGEQIAHIRHTGEIISLAVSGETLAAGAADRTVRVWTTQK